MFMQSKQLLTKLVNYPVVKICISEPEEPMIQLCEFTAWHSLVPAIMPFFIPHKRFHPPNPSPIPATETKISYICL